VPATSAWKPPHAPADGYTVFLGNVGTLAINPMIFGAKQRFTASAFVPVSLVSNVPDVLITGTSFRHRRWPSWSTMRRRTPRR